MISWQIEREIERQILLQYWHFYFHLRHLIIDVSGAFLFLIRVSQLQTNLLEMKPMFFYNVIFSQQKSFFFVISEVELYFF